MVSFNKFLIAAAVGVSLLLAACGSSSKPSSSASSAPASPYGQSSSTSGQASSASLTLSTAKGSAGTYLVGAAGRALYLWSADTNGKSSCSGSCTSVWTPLTASSVPNVSSGVSASDLSLITRSDGKQQVAYNRHPLYYYVSDTSAGMTNGEGTNSFGARWWLVAPSGSRLTTGASASAGSSTKASSSSGSSGGSSSGGSSGSSWG